MSVEHEDHTMAITGLMPPSPFQTGAGPTPPPVVARGPSGARRAVRRSARAFDPPLSPAAATLSGQARATPQPAAAEPGMRVAVLGGYLGPESNEGEFHVAAGAKYEIGARPQSPFCEDAFIEPRHAALTPGPKGVVVSDVASASGVYMRITVQAPVAEGTTVRIGQQLLRLQSLQDAAAGGENSLGCPNPGYWARIDMLLRDGVIAASYPVDDTYAELGRDEGHIQFPGDPYVSATHCRVTQGKAGLQLEDLESCHGTWVRVRDGAEVPYGSTLLVGHTMIRVHQNVALSTTTLI